MSKKQDFNKGYNSQTSICSRRASRLSKADLMSLILEIKNDLGNANWLIHQLLSTGELSEKNIRKGVRFLMCQGYDIDIKDSKPEKTKEETQRVHKQLDEANKLLKESLTHLKTFWKLTSSNNKKIIFSSEYPYELNDFISNASILTTRIEKELEASK